MNIQSYMDEASYTGEFGAECNITKGKIVRDAELYKFNVNGKDVEKVRFKVTFIGDDGHGVPKEYRLWWYPKPKDFLLLGNAWGTETTKWVGKNLSVWTTGTGRGARTRILPLP